MAGSIAATAPRLPPSPAKAACCALALMVVITLPPGTCSRVIAFSSGCTASLLSVPESTPSSTPSSRVLP